MKNIDNFREGLFSRRHVLVGFGLLGIYAVLPPFPKVFASGVAKNFTSIEELQNAIDLANPGDVLTLAPGTYTDTEILVSRSGITISAQSAGKVIFNGASKVSIKAD